MLFVKAVAALGCSELFKDRMLEIVFCSVISTLLLTGIIVLFCVLWRRRKHRKIREWLREMEMRG